MPDFPPQADTPPEQPAQASAAQQGRAQQIGERVRAARLAAHLTQQELGGATFSKSYLSAVERGKMTPSLPALRMLAERLGVSRAFLLGEDPRAPEEEAAPSAEGRSETAPADAAFQEGRALLRRQAEGCLREGRYEEALALGAQAEDVALMGRIRDAYGAFLVEQGRYEEAYEQLRWAQTIMDATTAETPPDTR